METILGYIVLGLAALLGLFITFQKLFTEPVNALNITMQQLIGKIDALTKDDERQNETLSEHGKQINDLHDRVGKVETKMEMYHKE
jgi:CHASE3 domain sensor protein